MGIATATEEEATIIAAITEEEGNIRIHILIQNADRNVNYFC